MEVGHTVSVVNEARSKLEAEISKLETLYFVSTITYKNEVKAQYRCSKGGDKAIVFKTADWEREVAHNAGHFKAIVDRILPQTLRETIFVRLISAVEVFHVDLVRAIFSFRRDLLSRDQKVELPYAYLASITTLSELITKLVDRDCRAITSGGFDDATKFFRQRFKIDLKQLPGYKHLSEAHDRRHLLVHRLGLTDEHFRHAYKQTRRRVSLDQLYLLGSINHIRNYADALIGEAAKLAIAPGKTVNRGKSDLSLHLKLESSEASDLTSPDFFFLYNEKYYSLRDLVRERNVVDDEIRLSLRGDSKVLRVYLRKIQVFADQNKLVILTPSKTRNVKQPKSK